jgi:hypothetical protein
MGFDEIWLRFILNIEMLACKFSTESMHPNWGRGKHFGPPWYNEDCLHLVKVILRAGGLKMLTDWSISNGTNLSLLIWKQ